jgi:hypothetical protein
MTSATQLRYRAGDVAVAPAGGGTAVLYSRDTGTSRLVRSEVGALLDAVGTFRTLEDHVREVAGGRAAREAPVRRELERLAAAGFLVTPPAGQSATPDMSLRVPMLAVPTCDRVPTLAHTLNGFLENVSRSGREVEVVVADDSASEASRAACVDMLRGLRRAHGVQIAYAGLEEKKAYVTALAAAAGVDRAAASFACLGDPTSALITAGANRNVLLLHAAGDPLLCVDDDIACRPAPALGADEALAVTSEGGPLRVEVYEDRQSALAALPERHTDLLALHERWLGRPPLTVVADDTDYRGATAPTLRRLRSRPGRIAVTLNGIVGDCGWDSPDFLLFLDGGQGRARSREMVQVAPRVTLTDQADPIFGWSLGLDARQMLPPFTPIGRAEDVGFGVLLTTCFPGHYAAHLPWALLHAPPEPKAFTSEPAFGVGFNGWLPSVLAELAPHGGPAPDRLAELGRQVQELGRLSDGDFDDFVHLHLLDNFAARTELLEARMATASPAWRKDASAEVARMRDSALAPLEQLYCLPGGRHALQRQLLAYGALLATWPALWSAALTLRANAQRPARRLQ